MARNAEWATLVGKLGIQRLLVKHKRPGKEGWTKSKHLLTILRGPVILVLEVTTSDEGVTKLAAGP